MTPEQFLREERRGEALRQAQGLDPVAKDLVKLGEEFGQEVAAWAIGMWQLRKRGAQKFSKSQEMLFTKSGLEMATPEAVSAWHAAQFDDLHVGDLTAGIGGDTIALARRGSTIALEVDVETAVYARHNLAVYGLPDIVEEQDCTTFVGDRSIYADPARRTKSRRERDSEGFLPPLSTLVGLAQQGPRTLFKLSPMLSDETLQIPGADLLFASYSRECTEALIGWGMKGWPKRGAVHIESGQVFDAADPRDYVDDVGAYLHEADPALIRAHALGELKAAALADSNGYLTSDSPLGHVMARSYPVVWSGPFRRDELKRIIMKEELNVRAVKLRGVKEDPAQVGKALPKAGARPAILLLYSVASKVRAVLALNAVG